LGGVNGGGVAEFHGMAYVAGWQLDGAPGTAMLHLQPAVTMSGEDSPAVAVLHPVDGGGAEPSVVVTGDDQLADTGPVSIRQGDLRASDGCRREAVSLGSPVQFGDQVAGGGEHDRIEPISAVDSPCPEQVLGEGGQVADADTLPVQVEAQRLRPAVTQRQRCGRFGGVLEAVQFGQPNRAVAAFDFAQDTAGADGGQLLIITDQPDAAAAANNELDGGVKGERVRHPRFIN
jgi:hypothetical protein